MLAVGKFTIFTIILSVSVITVMADVGVRKFVAAGGQASILTSGDVSPVLSSDAQKVVDPDTEEAQRAASTDSDAVNKKERTNPIPVELPKPKEIIPQPALKISQEISSQAGFQSKLIEKAFSGKLFDLLDISQNPVDAIGYWYIEESGVPAAMITEIILRDEIKTLQLYSLLQNKTKAYIDLSLNETNAYGDRSFYINHSKKPNEAFLTVRIKNRIYGFAYVKYFHPEVKKLIQLL